MTKRFYKNAAVHEAEKGFAVTLDGRPVKTPVGAALILPTRTLAEAVAGEWNAQGETVAPRFMPLTALSGTAIDRVPGARGDIIGALLRYADTDLLCHRAAHPRDLARRQNELWQPLLDWAAEELGARLTPVEGVLPAPQDPAARETFKAVLAEMDDWTLCALAELAGLTGSLVVGLAVVKGRLDAAAACDLCHVDEDHQSALWGEDAETAQRREHVCAELAVAARFLALATKNRQT